MPLIMALRNLAKSLRFEVVSAKRIGDRVAAMVVGTTRGYFSLRAATKLGRTRDEIDDRIFVDMAEKLRSLSAQYPA